MERERERERGERGREGERYRERERKRVREREREIERQREGNNSLRVGQGSQRFKPVPQGMIPTVSPMYRYSHHHKWREGGGGEGKTREGMGREAPCLIFSKQACTMQRNEQMFR